MWTGPALNRTGLKPRVLLDTSYLGWGVLLMVVGLLFCRWDVSDGFEKAPVVEPVDVFEGGVLDLVEVLPRSAFVDEFCLVQTDDGFGEGVIVGIANRADRR